MKFKVSNNNVYVQAREDPDQEWLPCDYNHSYKNVEKMISDSLHSGIFPLLTRKLSKKRKIQNY